MATSGFALHGTHGTIFPWQLPLGVSRKSLEAMRKELLTILNRALQDLTVRPQSAETSPAKSFHETRDVSPEDMAMWDVPDKSAIYPAMK